VAAGFLVKGVGSVEYALTVLGGIVVGSALCALAVRFTQEQKLDERRRYNDALALQATQVEADGVADVA
jgi:NNP family nitrate/nitrite transporter-like MFS transporter